MRILSNLGVAVIAGALLVTAAPAAASGKSFSVVASNYKFTPGSIKVAAGQKVTLHLTSTQGTHGVSSSQLGIANTTIAPGKPVDVTFTPTRPGMYKVYCSVFCGSGHATMILTITVA